MKKYFILTFLLLLVQSFFSQQDERPVVGVAAFTCDENPRFVKLVTEKVVEMLTNTKRFRVVDRTSSDKVKEELDKCILVCANCHREIHTGILDIKELIK